MLSERCDKCGAPVYITGEHAWLNNGDIVMKRLPGNRLVFAECTNIDPLFRIMEQIIGVPIEHMVISAARRAFISYLSFLVPEGAPQAVKERRMDFAPIAEAFENIALVMGQGRFKNVETRYEGSDDDHSIDLIEEPYSFLFACAAHAATVELLSGDEQSVAYEELSPGVYRSVISPSSHPQELKGRMRIKPYLHRDGDIELERCASCGGPKALSDFEWDLSRGVITSRVTGRRMAFFGPQMIDPVFAELEAELGETIPRVVVEAQRRFTRSGFYRMDEIADEGTFRDQLALRGLGNLEEVDIKRRGVHMRVGNAALPLIIVGLMQGAFEAALGVESVVDWELSGQDELIVEVTALGGA